MSQLTEQQADDVETIKRWLEKLKGINCVISVDFNDSGMSDYIDCVIVAIGRYPLLVTWDLPLRLVSQYQVDRSYDEGEYSREEKILGGATFTATGQSRPMSTYTFKLPREVFRSR